jgi:twitching motility protein PilT
MATTQKRPPLQRALQKEWKTDQELDELRDELLAARLQPAQILPLLYMDNARIREAAWQLYLENADETRIKALVNDMCWKTSGERRIVGGLFAKVPTPIIAPIVEWAIANEETQVATVGWEVALSVGGALRAKYLPRLLVEAPRALRLPALQKLVADSDPKTILTLLLRLSADEDARIVAVATEALAAIDDPQVVDLMIDAAGHANEAIRDRARTYLLEAARRDPSRLQARMLETLADSDAGIRRLAVEILLGGPDRPAVLVEIVRYARTQLGWVRLRLRDTLRSFGDDVLLPSIELLRHPDANVRTSALLLAGASLDPRAVPTVCELLSDPDPWIRIHACEILGKLRDERAVGPLVKALADDDARWAAVDALSRIGSEHALQPLVKTLSDPRKEIRLEVVRALGEFTDKRIIVVLKRVTEVEPTSEVRTRAQEVMRDMARRLDLEAAGDEKDTSATAFDHLTTALDRLLAIARRMDASDLHLAAGEPPYLRIHGKLERVEEGRVLESAEVREAALDIMGEQNEREMQERGQVDFCHQVPEVGRYRANVFRGRRGWSAVFRVIHNIPPTFATLRAPPQLDDVARHRQGLVVFAGPVGSGKSSTLAALVNLLGESKRAHVVTLEDPVEFVHPPKSALVDQREVPTHTRTFATGLRAALRQDPEVIVVGEMRDAETIRMALTAADAGHLVLATLHTASAAGTIARMVDVFPSSEQPQIRAALAESLRYVVAQFLLPRKDGAGRIAAFEILRATPAIGTFIRDNEIEKIENMIVAGRDQGMQSRDYALMALVEAGSIAAEVAWRRANAPEEFEPLCSAEFLAEVEHLRPPKRERDEKLL